MASNSTNKPKKSAKSKKPKKKPSKIKRFFKYFFLTILILGLLIGVIGVGYIYAVIKTAPPLNINAIYNLNETSMLFDDKGEFIDNLPSREERYVVKDYNTLPENLINAYISIEDERFLTHKGVDVKRLFGAAARDVLVILGKETGIHGASTITQQLVKNTILIEEAAFENTAEATPLDSINRKIKEISLAVKLDKELGKEEIIKAYLNTIPLGGYVYGVEAASRYYFAKSVNELSLLECAYIAGLAQAPTTYSAYNTEEPDYPNTYINRTETVLDKMLELGYISQAEYDSAYKDAEENKFNFSSIDNDYKLNQEWFVYPALDQVREDLKEKYKYTDEEVDKLFVNGGLKIYTTLNTEMQNKVQAVLDERSNLHVETDAYGNYIEDYSEEGVPLLQAAATVIDYRTGQVKALIGGRGEQPPNSLNNAYFDYKSIASTTKPLTVYGPAIDTKVMTAGTPIDDTPISDELKIKYGYPLVATTPDNYNHVKDGYITPRDAITYSKNLTSIKTVDKIGLETAIEYGERAGLKYSADSHTMAAAATGQFEQPVDDRDGGNTTIMASAFGSFGNNGVRIEPILYTKVEDASGKVLLEKEMTPIKLFSPQTAYIMYNILKDPLIYFDAGGAKFGDIPVSGKTGTTDLVDSFWFSGLTPYYSGSVWIGYTNPKAMTGYSTAAGDLWGSVMSVVHEGLGYKEIEEPTGIVKAAVCKDSGKTPTDLCSQDPRGNRVKTELFIEGTEPKSLCDVHVKAKVNKENNKLATDNTPKDLLEERVFIKKANAYKEATDYKYVLPTEKDDTKAKEKINLSQIGLSTNMDLYDAVVILNNKKIKYKFSGVSVSGSLSPGQYILTKFTAEIKEGDTVTLTVKKVEAEAPGIGNNPTTDNNGNNNDTSNPGDNNNDNNNDNNGNGNNGNGNNDNGNDNSDNQPSE